MQKSCRLTLAAHVMNFKPLLHSKVLCCVLYGAHALSDLQHLIIMQYYQMMKLD